MKMRLLVIGALTALTLLLGDFWMSRTKYNYARLLLFLIVPILLLEFVPPRPLRKLVVNPTVRFNAYLALAILSIVALVFSVLSWDQELWSQGIVFVTQPSEIFGTLYSVPYEECVWCVFHTLLAGLWVMSIWKSGGKPFPKRIQPLIGARCTTVVVCLGIAFLGYSLLESGEKSFYYLGAQLMWVFPIFAIQYGLSGHLYMPVLREYFLGVLVPSVYVVVIDTWALWRNIWGTDVEYTTQVTLFGLMFEQVLVYVLTTMLAVNGIVSAIVVTEAYLTLQPLTRGSSLNVLKRVMFW